jgi:Zn-dependent protease
VFSLLIPLVILLLGGLPLPGGATYIRRDLLRGRFWDSAVSLAGPAMNLLLFLACALPLHPAFGWVAPRQSMDTASRLQVFLGAMAVLQFLTVVLNLIPVPPLDGFQAIAPYLPNETRVKLSTPPLATWLFFGYFLFIWQVPGFIQFVARLLIDALWVLGFDRSSVYFIVDSYQLALYGHA